MKEIIGYLGVCISYLFGGNDLLIQTVVLFIVLDLVSGFLKAIYEKNLTSKKMYKGIVKKAMYFIVLILAYRMDELTRMQMFRMLTSYYIIATEGLSVLENVGEYVSYPDKLKEYLQQLKDKE